MLQAEALFNLESLIITPINAIHAATRSSAYSDPHIQSNTPDFSDIVSWLASVVRVDFSRSSWRR